MKKAIIFSIIIFISVSLKSQGYQTWSDPIALTDSLSFNSNPTVINYGWGNSSIFYEKRQSLSGNREIWWKNPYGPISEEQVLIGGFAEIDYRNPKVINYNFLIFECNATNNDKYDIFGVKFDENGLVGNSFRLTNTEYDENSFYGTSTSPVCCWEGEGDIFVANIESIQDTLQFTNIEIIDTANCLEPVCKSNFIAWRKVENGESHIYYSEIEYPSTQWSDPDTIIQTNDNTNLSISRAIDYWGEEGSLLCWQSSDSIHFSGTPGWNIEIITPGIEGIDHYYEPTSFDLDFLTDDYFPGLCSFAGETGSIRDIYINDYWFFSNPVNITNDPEVNKNPELFFGGEFNYYYDVFNIWQTEKNGYDVLYMSTASYLLGAINENKSPQIEISPNPVSNNQNIIISPAENISIHSAQIYFVSGKLILETNFNEGSGQYEIDLGNALPGVYLIKVQTSNGEVVRKLIKK